MTQTSFESSIIIFSFNGTHSSYRKKYELNQPNLGHLSCFTPLAKSACYTSFLGLPWLFMLWSHPGIIINMFYIELSSKNVTKLSLFKMLPLICCQELVGEISSLFYNNSTSLWWTFKVLCILGPGYLKGPHSPVWAYLATKIIGKRYASSSHRQVRLASTRDRDFSVVASLQNFFPKDVCLAVFACF